MRDPCRSLACLYVIAYITDSSRQKAAGLLSGKESGAYHASLRARPKGPSGHRITSRWSMSTISITDARARLPELVDDVSGRLNEYVITKHGRAHAVLVSAEEYEALLETLEILSDSATMERIRSGLDEIARGETASFEDVFGEAP